MSGSNLLIIQSGFKGKKSIYHHLKELEVLVTVVHTPKKPWREAASAGHIHGYIEADKILENQELAHERRPSAVNDAIAEGAIFDGRTTHFEDAIVACKRVAETLGMSVNPVESFFQS